MKYRREVDGLRAVAVVPVILWHAGFALPTGGFAGVDVFFVISGFLITTILGDELAQGRYSILRFYERRARRILPALFLVIAVSYFFAWRWMQPAAFVGYSQSIAAATFFYSNIYFWQATDYFAVADGQLPLLHTWSLAVEEQFYLVFPLVLWALWRLVPRYIPLILIGAALASLALSEWGWRAASEANFFLAPTRAWELLAGASAAFFCQRRVAIPPKSQIMSALGLMMVLASFFIYDERTPFPSIYTLLPVAGTVMMLVFARQGTFAATLLSWPLFVGIGKISYSAYLWHQPIFALARIRLPEPPSMAMMAGLSLASLVLAALTWWFVEQPMRLSRGPGAFSIRRFSTMMGLTALVLAATAVFGVVQNGASFRFAPDVNKMTTRLSDEAARRDVAIGAGKCDFNTKKVNLSLDTFMKNWSCQPRMTAQGVASDVAIYGDSHAADIAAAMRLNGQNVLQVTGAGCPLDPAEMLRKCRRLADFFKSKLGASGIREIWLANRFYPPELTRQSLERVVNFWATDGITLRLFSPMPEFADMRDKLIKSAWLQQDIPMPREMAMAELFFSPENRASLEAARLSVVDSGAIYCAAIPDCAPWSDNQFWMIDGQHLSVEGALRFGAVLRARLALR